MAGRIRRPRIAARRSRGQAEPRPAPNRGGVPALYGPICLRRSLATIDITRPHTLGPDGARRAAGQIADRLVAEYGVRAWWDGPALHVSGRGIDGRLDADAETVRVVARLGLLARPFAGPLRREIERELDRVAPLS